MGTAALEPQGAMTSSNEPNQLQDPQRRDEAMTFLGRSLLRIHAVPWRRGDRGWRRLEVMADTTRSALGLQRRIIAFVDDGRPVTFASDREDSPDGFRLVGVGGTEVTIDVPAGIGLIPTRALTALDFPDAVSLIGMSSWMALAAREVQGIQWALAMGWLPVDRERTDPRLSEPRRWMEEAIQDGASPSAEAWAREQNAALVRTTQHVPRLALRRRGRGRLPSMSPSGPIPARPCRWTETESLDDLYANRYVTDVVETPGPTQQRMFEIGADMARSHPDPNWAYPEAGLFPLDHEVTVATTWRVRDQLGGRRTPRWEGISGPDLVPAEGEILLDAADSRMRYQHPRGMRATGETAVRLGAHFGVHQAQLERIRALRTAQLAGELPMDPEGLSTFWRQAHEWRQELIEGRTGPGSSIEHWAGTIAEAVSDGYLHEMELQNRHFDVPGAGGQRKRSERGHEDRGL
jgi:hypothetical protein